MRRLQTQYGMTLLEVLVATAILVIISSMAFLSIDNLASAKQYLDEKNKSLNQENLAYYLFQNDLQMAIASEQLINNLPQGEFIANSQSITLLKYKSPTAPVKLSSNRMRNSKLNDSLSPLLRVRWYVRNNTWYRATQAGVASLTDNRWQERVMLEVTRFSCGYQNVTGQTQPIWPNEQRQFSQLPQQISCEVENTHGQISKFNVVPLQKIGFL